VGTQIREVMTWARNRKLAATFLVITTLGIGIVVGSVFSGHTTAGHATFVSEAARPLTLPDPVVMSSTFASIIHKVEPAVVNISTTQVITEKRMARHQGGDNNGDSGGNGLGSGGKKGGSGADKDKQDPLQDYFDRFFGGDQGSGDPANQDAERSLGSGVIVDPQGYILTNNHVVDQATRVQVQLDGDPTKYNAKVVGTDVDTDLAVIKIEAGHELPFAKLGNSDGVQVGDWVLAIGSPFGLRATVTAGIISAKDRTNMTDQQFQRFLQTDAAINPGNSGGPLVDLAGQVIGINTAILTGTRSYGNEGVGFALPSRMALGVYNQIVMKGHVTRGSIGVEFQEEPGTNPIVLRNLGTSNGVVLQIVEPGGPADRAGIKPGDVITEVGGKAVHTGSDLVDPIAETPIGDKVKLTVVHNRQAHEVSVTVDDRNRIFPDRAAKESVTPVDADVATSAGFGIHVEELTAERARRVGLQPTPGVMVAEVDPASFGEDVLLSHGDVITEINDMAVTTVAEYKKAIAGLKPGQDVVFKVLRSQGQNDRTATVLLAGVVPAEEK
jgi:serine protease Do